MLPGSLRLNHPIDCWLLYLGKSLASFFILFVTSAFTNYPDNYKYYYCYYNNTCPYTGFKYAAHD